jgi:hypothetical protein
MHAESLAVESPANATPGNGVASVMRTQPTGWTSAAAAVLAAALLSGCAAAMQGNAEPVDPSIAAQVAAATAPSRPLHVVFDWTLRERDARFNGQGSARIAPGYRARLDLFGPRGEAYLAAALIGTDLRLSAAPDATGELPPSELLWTVLGTFHPPERAELVGTRVDGGTTRLEYSLGNERWRFRFADGILEHAEWEAGRSGRRTVELRARGAGGLPTQAFYRDWLEFRELTLTLSEVHEVDGFPADIWNVRR